MRQLPSTGSYEDTGLNAAICFDSRSRYRPYGYEDDGASSSKVDWDLVSRGEVQRACVEANRKRYAGTDGYDNTIVFTYPTPHDVTSVNENLHFPEDESRGRETALLKKRSAIVFRVEALREWTIDTIQYLRTVVMETSLHTGGEYELVIMVKVRDEEGPIFNNVGVHREVLGKVVPKEFQHLSVLYNEKILKSWYPRTFEDRATVRSGSESFQALQLLSLARSDLEFFWDMDADARFIGHHYDLFENMALYSKAQSRDSAWRAASLVYVPGVHDNWDSFSEVAKKHVGRNIVHGPVRTYGIELVGPDAPSIRGRSQWGRGEEADLITVGPIYDPANPEADPELSVSNYPDDNHTPWRMLFSPQPTRLSKRLLRAMHYGQVTLGTDMASSMFPVSTALHHGLKVASLPLSTFLNLDISPDDLEQRLNGNASNNTFREPSEFKDVWRQITFGVSLDDGPTYADELYKRWFGYDDKETEGLCVPSMLLHPVRAV